MTRALSALALASFLVGLAFRVAVVPPPHGDTLANHYPIEDGYLTLTIAREMAIGHGMSTGEGAYPTNGTQPLFTFLASLVFLAVSGQKTAGVIGVLVLELVIALASSYVLYRLAKRWLGPREDAEGLARMTAGAWLAAPLVAQHSMNGLESGLYVLVTLVTLVAMPSLTTLAAWTARRTVGMGALLGLIFWARNDAVFFILAFCLVMLFTGPRAERTRRLGLACLAGTTSVAVAAPWLVANVVRFSHLMPISGVSEGLDARFGENAAPVLVAFVEHALVVLPIPQSLEQRPIVLVLVLALAGVVLTVLRAKARTLPVEVRPFIAVVAIYGGCLLAFFGLYFGAAHFASRYVFPLSPYLTFFFVLALADLRARVPRLAVVAAAVAFLLGVANTGRAFLRAGENEHRAQVEWVRENVPPHVWVAAVQTGTLGFYHDRTINLDGKVNAEALEARIERREHAYAASSEAAYVVDWLGLTSWLEDAHMARAFEVHVHDPSRNLTVLKRRAAHAQAGE